MKKSVYSIILSDEIVEEIDRLAYSLKTSRSNLINEILAKHISYVTPEKRMREILSMAQKFLSSEGNCFFPEMQSPSFLDIRAALKYKYKPTIRYCVELYTKSGGPFGRLKVSVRTQSESLIREMADFFKIWNAIENKLLYGKYGGRVPSAYENNCYMRDFYVSGDLRNFSEDILGRAIAEYVCALDRGVKIYLGNADNGTQAFELVAQSYEDYLQNTEMII